MEEKIIADFLIDASAQMNTFEEEAVWNSFIENFQLFLTDSIDFKKANQEVIKKSRKSGLAYVGWAISGVIIGGIAGMFLAHLTGINLFTYVGIPIGGTLLLANRIKYKKNKSHPLLINRTGNPL